MLHVGRLMTSGVKLGCHQSERRHRQEEHGTHGTPHLQYRRKDACISSSSTCPIIGGFELKVRDRKYGNLSYDWFTAVVVSPVPVM